MRVPPFGEGFTVTRFWVVPEKNCLGAVSDFWDLHINGPAIFGAGLILPSISRTDLDFRTFYLDLAQN